MDLDRDEELALLKRIEAGDESVSAEEIYYLAKHNPPYLTFYTYPERLTNYAQRRLKSDRQAKLKEWILKVSSASAIIDLFCKLYAGIDICRLLYQWLRPMIDNYMQSL